MSDKKRDENIAPDPLSGVTGDRVIKEIMIPLKERASSLIGWGIFCIVLGTLGLIYPFAFSVGVTIFLGAMLFVSGITGIVLFWRAHGWKPRVGALVLAFLTTIVGLLFMLYPLFGAETLVLFLASYFIAAGIVKAWVAFTNMDAKRWGLLLFSAIISLILGGCLWWGWPATAPYIFGVFVAIELIFDGWTVLLIGLKVREFNKNKPVTATATFTEVTPAPAAPNPTNPTNPPAQ